MKHVSILNELLILYYAFEEDDISFSMKINLKLIIGYYNLLSIVEAKSKRRWSLSIFGCW